MSNDKLQEIKDSLNECTMGEWIFNGNEIVSSENLNCGIGGFLTAEDNNLVVLMKKNISWLISQLEQAQAENQTLKTYVSCYEMTIGPERELANDYQKINRDLVLKNQKLVEALKWYEHDGNYDVIYEDGSEEILSINVLDDRGQRARQALSQYTNTSDIVEDKEE